MKNKRKILIVMMMLAILLLIPSIARANSDIVVMLDPGHGGGEPGAIGGGIIEKDVNWKIATKVKEILDNTPGITGILTRGKDENPSLYDRGIKARDNNADLLISFHINSNDNSSSLSGAEVYVTANTNQARYYQSCNTLGLRVLQNLRSVGVPSHAYKPLIRYSTDGELYEDGFLSDYYGIIRNPMYYGIPAILIEHCYINNPSDRANFLGSDAKIYAMAEADAKAIIQNKELFRRNYYGQINTVLNEMNLITGANGDKYLSGSIDIAEWVDNNCNKPKDKPLLTLKSTDGTISKNIFSYWKQGITYYYDINIDQIDPNKEYYIEAYLTSSENIAPTKNKTQKVLLPNITFGKGKNGTISASNNLLKFQYEGETASTLKTIDIIQSSQTPYVTGTVKVEEIVNGKTYRANSNQITFLLEATDGSFSKKMYSYYQGNGIFYFDTRIDKLDTQKTYHLIAKNSNPNNIASPSKKEKEIGLQEKTTIGNSNELHLEVENNTFRITREYKASIQISLQNIAMNVNGEGRHYIYGNIRILEGNNQVSSTLPKLTLKNQDESIQNMYINHSGNGNYYFDTYIEDLDPSKQYYIEASLTNPDNIASESQKTQKVAIGQQSLGEIKGYKVMIENGNLQYIDASLYIGAITTNLQNLSFQDNGAGRHYICGNIQIIEKIEGKQTVPTTIPQLILKTEDGFTQKMYINHSGNGNYYFDTYVEDLDLGKQYKIEASLTNPKNIATQEQKMQTVTIQNKELGKWKGKKVVIQNNTLQFIEADKYQGTISTQLQSISLQDNGAGRHYICGNIQIKENIDGKTNISVTLPELTLKADNGYSQKMYIYHVGNGIYYYDTYIEELDTTKQYYIQAKLTNTNNTASESNKTQKVVLPTKEIGKVKGKKVVIQNNTLQFVETDKYQETISTQLQSIGLQDNGTGRHYICGNIQIKEIIGGKTTVPNALPELVLKSDDGYSQKMYVYHVGNGIYYYDTYIEELSTTRQYYMQAKLTNTNNSASESQKTQTITMKDQTLGKTNQNLVVISNGKISLQPIY